MRILIINANVKNSSTGKIAYGFYKKLKAYGHEAVLAFGMGESIDDKDPDLVKFTPYLEPKFHFRYNLITGYHGLFGPVSSLRLNKLIDSFKPDLIQLYNLHGYFMNIHSLFKKLSALGIPAVYGMLDEYPYLGYCCYAYDCEKYKDGCRNCTHEFNDRYLKSLFFNRARQTWEIKKKDYDSVKKLVFTAPEWVVKRAEESSLLAGRDIRVVDEYVDNKETFIIRDPMDIRREHNIGEDKIILLDVAPSYDPRKGVSCFIELARRFEKDERFVFINVGYKGSGEDLPSNFIGVGFVSDQKKLAEYYSAADLFICTSFADTMPNSCLDAMSCGTPVLGFDITGIPYIAKAPVGRFIKPGDLDEMSSVVCSTKKKDSDLVMECREYALRRYSIDTYYEKQMEIYEDLLT